MDERNIQEAIHILQNDGYLKNEQITVGDEKRGFRIECMVNFLMRLYRIKVPYHTREWINSRLRLLKIEDGKCTMCCYCWGRNNNTPKNFYRCMEELISAVNQDSKNERC